MTQTVNQQLIFAVHQICTQIYPEIFLTLSLNQRQKFQARIRHIVRDFQPKLLTQLASKGILLSPVTLEVTSPLLEETETVPLDNQEFAAPKGLEALLSQPPKPHLIVNSPEDLNHWCRELEREMNRHLTDISHETNLLLQKVEILSPKLPPQILEMALQAEEGGMNMGQGGMPNILSIVVETRRAEAKSEKPEDEDLETNEDEDEEDNQEEEMAKNSQILKIAAIHLRLSELEFADVHLSLTRKQLRNLGEQLNKLRKQYRQLKREYLRSEAEMAWRASWTEN
ncbi:MAG: hypothetical protein KA717_11230 [Woronichinia naegeliana WA131]|uniref:Uncharacterized protein n=1 Tax=Woronichinia naegeliana WA131 TaxID=2824559 RepID=A0A977PXT9_9CYAN|nr:MAG: hypothetical protein KA717_11230 [Woronichinia naegeliana WA131]